jgi:hypothetical protein
MSNVNLTEPEQAALAEDATNRSVRTIWQGLGVDVLIAVALLITNIFTDANGWGELDWKIIGFTLMKTVLMAAAAYIMRRFIDPSKVPTPLPPAPQPTPAEPASAPADFPMIPGGFAMDTSDLDWPENPEEILGHMPKGVDIPGGEPQDGMEDIDTPTDLERELGLSEDKGGA